MNKINWQQKLSSRKFWVALTGFVTPLLLAFNATDDTVAKVTAIIMGGGTLMIYILSEGNVDAKRIEKEKDSTKGA